jgi:hypothetical protein
VQLFACAATAAVLEQSAKLTLCSATDWSSQSSWLHVLLQLLYWSSQSR